MWVNHLGDGGERSETWRLKPVVIPVTNTVTNKVARLPGNDEDVKRMNLAINQGQPAKKSLNTIVSIAGFHEIPGVLPNSLDVS